MRFRNNEKDREYIKALECQNEVLRKQRDQAEKDKHCLEVKLREGILIDGILRETRIINHKTNEIVKTIYEIAGEQVSKRVFDAGTNLLRPPPERRQYNVWRRFKT